MTWKNDTLYHGTVLSSAEAIRDSHIDTEINMVNELDFGYGFYLGDKLYARRIAMDKARGKKSAIAVIMEYRVDFPEIRAAFADGLIFESRTKRFVDTVFNCRYRKGERYLNVPYVIAPIADGLVDQVMSWYTRKETTFRKAVTRLMYALPGRHRQFVVKDPKVCEYLHLVRISNMKGEVLWEENSEATE